jgi:hypothetical protein
MLITIVYESLFGATRRVAEAIARGAERAGADDTVTLRRVGEVSPEDVAASDILVVGGPTHVHSMTRPATRAEAEKWSKDPEKGLTLEPGALGSGVREFVRDLDGVNATFVSFDTRADSAEIFTGSAAKAIRKGLRKKGLKALLPAQSFVVTPEGHLVEGEEERATVLGQSLVSATPNPLDHSTGNGTGTGTGINAG